MQDVCTKQQCQEDSGNTGAGKELLQGIRCSMHLSQVLHSPVVRGQLLVVRHCSVYRTVARPAHMYT